MGTSSKSHSEAIAAACCAAALWMIAALMASTGTLAGYLMATVIGAVALAGTVAVYWMFADLNRGERQS